MPFLMRFDQSRQSGIRNHILLLLLLLLPCLPIRLLLPFLPIFLLLLLLLLFPPLPTTHPSVISPDAVVQTDGWGWGGAEAGAQCAVRPALGRWHPGRPVPAAPARWHLAREVNTGDYSKVRRSLIVVEG